MNELRVERADNCIWLIDDRGNHQEVHLTPKQANEIGQKLIDISAPPDISNQPHQQQRKRTY